MSLKDTWKPKVQGEDYINADDINAIADQAIKNETAINTIQTPYIGTNGNWFIYDSTYKTYVDSGKKAQGEQGPQGAKGEQGEKGETGPQGNKGEKGDPLNYDEMTETQKEDLADRVADKIEVGNVVDDEVIGAAERLYYYGDANIKPSNANLFELAWRNEQKGIAKIKKADVDWDLKELVIPYEYKENGKVYKITGIAKEGFSAVPYKKVIIPSSVITIERLAFYECEVEDFVFCGKEITIESGDEPFANGDVIKNIYYRGTEEEWENNVFGKEHIPDEATIHFDYLHEANGLPKEVIPLTHNMRIEAREDGIYLCGEHGDSLIYQNDYNSTVVDLARNADAALMAYYDAEYRELKGTTVNDYGDYDTLDLALYDGVIASCGVITTALMVSLGSDWQQIGFTSALYFKTPNVIPENYSQFPADIYFKGDSTDNGAFVPEANMRYTIVFDFDGYMMNAYVSGVTTV